MGYMVTMITIYSNRICEVITFIVVTTNKITEYVRFARMQWLHW